jgi:UDPglucose--hexose-1-phosphate uridylyltransferase
MIEQAIADLIAYEVKQGVINDRDIVYVKNQLYKLLDLTVDESKILEPKDLIYPSDALNIILDDLEKRDILDGSSIGRDLFDSKIMNIFADKPSVVEKIFDRLYQSNPRDAMLWYYNYAQSLNYIRMDRIAKNQEFSAHTPSGNLQITINLSKPEKDPKSIMMQAKQQATSYPKCVLCVENEGFAGHATRDSRNQHRLLKFNMNGDNWYFQYSPYIYYNEHAIVIQEKHQPMKISALTFKNLIDLTNRFEGYFFGSNADLPIVGGSILSHNHYQGGHHNFPIQDASTFYEEDRKTYKLELLNWPLSTIRLSSKDKDVLVEKASLILDAWKKYKNDALDIVAYTNTTRHHTITPVVRKENNIYSMYLILRDNHTSDKHPLGVFHPHEDVWHIKKENIGLIEAIGLAILPKRLVEELDAVKAYVLEGRTLNDAFQKHESWAISLKETYQADQDIDQFIQEQVGLKFERVLADCGVFKMNKDEKEMISFVKEALK